MPDTWIEEAELIEEAKRLMRNKDDADPLIGKQIDNFKILTQVGVGGFSTVYEVEAEGLPGQRFALKLVRDPAYKVLLEAEAQILSLMHHPGVPFPVKMGTCAEGSYLVMQFVMSNLKRYLESSQNQRLSCEEATRLTLELLQILQYTHSQNIIHKDIKPSNIGLRWDREAREEIRQWHPVLLDFNISNNTTLVKPQKKESIDNSQIQHSEVLKIGNVERSLIGGTQGYASPEQLKLKVEGFQYSVTPQTDLYSLGVIFYQMLTGYLPQGNYKPASHLVKTLPAWVDAIVSKALAPNPNDRFQDAPEMRSAILTALDNRRCKTTWGQRATSFKTSITNRWSNTLAITKKYSTTLIVGFLIIGALSGIAYFISNTVENNKQTKAKLEAAIKNAHLTGTIIYKEGHCIYTFKAKDISELEIPLTQIKCPCEVVQIAYINTNNSVAWIGQHVYNDYKQRRGAIFITNLNTKITRQVLLGTDVNDEIYQGFGAKYAHDIIDLCASKDIIYIKFESSGRWYRFYDGSVLPISRIESNSIGDISPDGLWRIRNEGHRLFLEKADGTDYKWLNLNGQDPLWIFEEK